VNDQISSNPSGVHGRTILERVTTVFAGNYGRFVVNIIEPVDESRRNHVMARIQTAMAVYAFGVLGLFLLAVPWTSVWDQVTVALLPQALGGWVRTGWARGAVSGLGALDLMAAAKEARALWRGLRLHGKGS
jgi:hypothetical protein